MIGLSKIVFKEAYISAKLRELSCGQDFKKAEKIRKKQQEHWNKYCFYKNLSEANNKINKK